MTPERYRQFLDELTACARGQDDVLALVTLGSTASVSHEPDEWSDHDVWLVTADGAASALRDDLSWLPDADRIVLVHRETEHGRGVVYDDGHLVELAVFDEREVDVVRLNDARLLLGDDAMQQRLDALRSTTVAEVASRPDADQLFQQWVVQVIVGLGRWARGERLSANQRIRGFAATQLVQLIASTVPPEQDAALDDLDTHRRFEHAWPTVAARLDAALAAPVPATVDVMLDIVETELAGRLPALTPEALAAVRAVLARAR